MNYARKLKIKIQKKKAKICIIGLGYVGLPMAIRFVRMGFEVYGLDNNRHRLKSLSAAKSYITDVSDAAVGASIKKGFEPTSNEKVLSASDIIIVCVPTPIRKTKAPNMSYIIAACRTIKKYLKPGQLVILESTTYPGTTREVMLPILEKSKLREGEDFFLAFSPERIDPGNKHFDFVNIPKVVGGVSKHSTQLACDLYGKVVSRVIPVKNAESAEVVKLLENTFRIVNIALINEFAMLAHKLHIDIWDVVEAAKSKPFGYMPFYPGPGIGGHCIPHDPHYLAWKAKTIGFKTNMIDTASKVNAFMPRYVIGRVKQLLKKQNRTVKGAKVLILGVTYKKDVFDIRESPALEVIEGLKASGARVQYSDPLVPYLKINSINLKSRKLTVDALKKADIAVIITDHTDVDYRKVFMHAKCVFDTRNVTLKNKHKKNLHVAVL